MATNATGSHTAKLCSGGSASFGCLFSKCVARTLYPCQCQLDRAHATHWARDLAHGARELQPLLAGLAELRLPRRIRGRALLRARLRLRLCVAAHHRRPESTCSCAAARCADTTRDRRYMDRTTCARAMARGGAVRCAASVRRNRTHAMCHSAVRARPTRARTVQAHQRWDPLARKPRGEPIGCICEKSSEVALFATRGRSDTNIHDSPGQPRCVFGDVCCTHACSARDAAYRARSACVCAGRQRRGSVLDGDGDGRSCAGLRPECADGHVQADATKAWRGLPRGDCQRWQHQLWLGRGSVEPFLPVGAVRIARSSDCAG